jgi:hypothetical protein
MIRPAANADLPAVLGLLESRGLPAAGVADWIEDYAMVLDGEALGRYTGSRPSSRPAGQEGLAEPAAEPGP